MVGHKTTNESRAPVEHVANEGKQYEWLEAQIQISACPELVKHNLVLFLPRVDACDWLTGLVVL